MQNAFDFLSEKDPIFKAIFEKYGMPTVPKRPQGFETLVLLILEQQVSTDAAKATFLKIKKATSITPEAVLLMSDEVFRVCGTSRQKTAYIKGLASAILNKEIDLEGLALKTPQQVREELIQLKGIGHWTIDVYLMFALAAPDIIPLGDVAVVTTIKELLGLTTKEAMEIHVANWSPHRSAATFLLWHYYLQKRNRKVEYNP